MSVTEPSAPSPVTPADVRAAAERFRADFGAVRAQIQRVIVGHESVIEGLLTCLFCSGHLLLEGVPGIGKTLLVRTLARAVSMSFGRIQFTPDLMPADITGTQVVAEFDAGDGRRERRFRFQPGPVFAQIVLADEVNRATPKTQSALLEAMQERSVTVGGETHPLPSPFLVMATQNPIEQEGTYPLPEAQLDRFFFKVLVGAPRREELGVIVNRTTAGVIPDISPALDGPTALAHQALVRRVAMPEHTLDYISRLVVGTHPTEPSAPPNVKRFVRLGASPRAAQTLALAAKCRALLQSRTAAATDDVRAAALPALRHRLILNFEAHAEGVTPDSIIDSLVATVPPDAPE